MTWNWHGKSTQSPWAKEEPSDRLAICKMALGKWMLKLQVAKRQLGPRGFPSSETVCPRNVFVPPSASACAREKHVCSLFPTWLYKAAVRHYLLSYSLLSYSLLSYSLLSS